MLGERGHQVDSKIPCACGDGFFFRAQDPLRLRQGYVDTTNKQSWKGDALSIRMTSFSESLAEQ